MGDQELNQGRPMSEQNEEANRTPGASGQNPPSTTSEPGYGGSQGQQQPDGGQRPGDDTESAYRPGNDPAEGKRDPDPMTGTDENDSESRPVR